MKYIVITGASSGIGKESARLFAKEGKNLIISARRRPALMELKRELEEAYGVDVKVISADLTRMGAVCSLYYATKEYDLEAWINCAGLGDEGKVADMEPDKASKLLDINVKALTILSNLFVKDYKDVPGTQLINVSSAGGYTIVTDEVTYSASKFYVSAFTEGLARELEYTGSPMKVKVLAPANTETGFFAAAIGAESFDYSQFEKYDSVSQVAEYMLQLYHSDRAVGIVDRENFEFTLRDPEIRHAYK